MPKSEGPRKEKEEAIFESALKVIKQKGLHRARMSDIARGARISYGLVYHYFKNKEELFEALLNQWWEGLFKLMNELRTSDRPVPQKLDRIIYHFLDTYQEHPELVNIFITESSRSTANLTLSRLEHFKRFISQTDSLMVEGQDGEILRSDFKARYLTYVFLGSLETFITAMVLVDQRLKGDRQKKEIAHGILEIFLNGAKNRPDRGSGPT